MKSLQFNPTNNDHSGATDHEELTPHPLDASLRAWHDENRDRASPAHD